MVVRECRQQVQTFDGEEKNGDKLVIGKGSEVQGKLCLFVGWLVVFFLGWKKI